MYQVNLSLCSHASPSLLFIAHEVDGVNVKLRKSYGNTADNFSSHIFGSATTATARVASVLMGLTD